MCVLDYVNSDISAQFMHLEYKSKLNPFNGLGFIYTVVRPYTQLPAYRSTTYPSSSSSVSLWRVAQVYGITGSNTELFVVYGFLQTVCGAREVKWV